MNAPGLTAQDATPATGGVREIAAVLLLVQAAVALVALAGALGAVVFSHGAPSTVVTFALSLLTVLLLPVLAAGALRRRRWAYVATIAYETLALAGYALNLTLGLLPQVIVGVTAVTLAGNVVLPLAIIALLIVADHAERTGSRPSEG